MRSSRRIALIAVFAAVTTILDTLVTPVFSSGVWYGWAFVMSPINGMILGPLDGFVSTLISVLLGHTLVFRDTIYEYVFTLGAPIGSLMAGMVFKGDMRWALAYFAALLGAYFLSPVGRGLPVWGMWDVYLAFTVLLGLSVLGKRPGGAPVSSIRMKAALGALIGLEADIMLRVFVLVPLRGYELFAVQYPRLYALQAIVLLLHNLVFLSSRHSLYLSIFLQLPAPYYVLKAKFGLSDTLSIADCYRLRQFCVSLIFSPEVLLVLCRYR